jgi:uncharacterized protein
MSVKGSSNDLISKLGLHPHVEGGFFREMYRSGATPMAPRGKTDTAGTTDTREDGQKRNELTSIIYMLTRDQPMQCMCLNRSPLVHYWQGGGPCSLFAMAPDTSLHAASSLGLCIGSFLCHMWLLLSARLEPLAR